MSILNDIKGLFLPPVCPVCGGELHEGEGAFCMMCRTLAPQTGFWRRADNPLAERLRNEFPVVQASAFLWFVAGSPWQRAIHGFKYYNRWRTARDLGAWYGGNLAASGGGGWQRFCGLSPVFRPRGKFQRLQVSSTGRTPVRR